MPSYNRSFLKEEEKERLGRRLSHYLEDYLYRNKVTHANAAKRLQISPNKFTQLKSGGEQGRFLTSMDYLKSLANLQGISVAEFVTYLEGKNEKADPKTKYTWLDKIYKALEQISISHRRKYADAISNASLNDNDRVELMCRLATAVEGMEIKALRSIVDGFERISDQQ